MDDDQGRERLFAISTNHPLSSQPDFKPTLARGLVPFRGPLVPGRQSCLSVTVVAAAENSRRECKIFTFYRIFLLLSPCCFSSPGACLKLATTGSSASRGDGKPRTTRPKPNHGDYRVASFLSEFFFVARLPVSCWLPCCPGNPARDLQHSPAAGERAGGGGFILSPSSPFSARKCNLDE